MAKTAAFSLGEGGRGYHDNTDCTEGNNIETQNRRSGDRRTAEVQSV